MDSPLLYLTVCSMRNRLRVRLRRLREPRYLIGSVVGIAYFSLVFGRPFFSGRRYVTPGGRAGGPTGLLDLIGGPAGQFAAAGLLFVVVAIAWVWPSSRRPALAFTRADVQLLFTAPIARWRLVRYKILRSQLAAFISSAVVTFFMRPARMAQGWTFFIGFSLISGLLNLHFTGISLTRVSAAHDSGRSLVRRWLPLAIVVTLVAIVAGDLLVRESEIAAAAASGSNAMAEIARIGGSGLSGVVLWPFRALVRLPLAASPAAFAAALPWTLLALALNYVWILRIDVPFEEASAELSEKLARVRKEGLKALRTSRPAVATPFRLAHYGPSETAILWKNLISMGRFLSWVTLLRFVPLLFVLIAFLTRRGSGSGSLARMDAFAMMSLLVAAFAVVLGPQITRSDLRQDLPNLAVLRTWPLRGATLVRGEVLAPAVLLVAIAWMALLAAAIFSSQGAGTSPLRTPWAYLAATMAVTPGVILVQLLVQNALAVTFPSWVTVGRPKGGVDMMGQRMVLMIVSLLALLLTLLPAAIVAGGLAFLIRAFTGQLPIVLPGAAAAAVLLSEAFLASELVGQILDRTDVAALDPADA